MKLLLVLSSLLLVTPLAEAKRSHAARAAFAATTPCPVTGNPKPSCPGYVIDHVVPLCAGGADHPSNMQWQSSHEAKRKDREERALCRRR